VIVKKVPTSKVAAPKSKAHNVRALADYIAGPHTGGDGEKVEHRGALNLLNIDHDGQVEEMIDLAETARRSPQPVQHWIMSWREGEQPTPAQANEAVAIFLDEMGLGRHQVIYALHRDTKNCHLHLAVNRVDPETERVVTVNNGFDHEIAHRAIARVQHLQGWQREDRGLFVARPDGELERSQPRGEHGRQLSSRARDFEERAGERSAQRIALEVAAPIIREAGSWDEMHEALGREGFRFERKGSGAILWIGSEAVKASSAGRECSMSALQKRLGEFSPSLSSLSPTLPEHVPQSIGPVSPVWDRYVEERSRHGQERVAEREHTAQQQRDEWRCVLERHRRERADILGQSWMGRGELLNATRSILAARQAQEKAELRDQQKVERADLQKEHGIFLIYRDWLAKTSPDLADEWRYRERRPAAIEGPTFEEPAPRDIRAFSAVVDGWQVHYHVTGEHGTPAFTDRGKVIDIRDCNRRESVLAALQLSAQKWGTFTVHGNEEFRRLCAELAAEHGFKVANPELQQAISVERDHLERDHLHAVHERSPPRSVATSLAEAYRLHFSEVSGQAIPGNADPSRLDAEVAVRLRVTGHHRDGIARAIREGASIQRPGEERDWDTYARRAVDFAFSVPGSQLASHLARQREHLLMVEGRHLERVLESRLGGPLQFDR